MSIYSKINFKNITLNFIYFFKKLFQVDFLKNDIKCSGFKILYGTWRLYSIGIKNKNTTSEVSIIFIQIHKKRKLISKLIWMSCAGWNPTNLWKYKQYSYIIKMKWRNFYKIENLREKMHSFKNSGMEDLRNTSDQTVLKIFSMISKLIWKREDMRIQILNLFCKKFLN